MDKRIRDMKTTKPGLDIIRHFEGLRLRAYLCPGNIWTIGYGHTRTAVKGRIITEAEANELLRSDLSDTEWAIKGLIPHTTLQHEFDALVSLAFNIGWGAFTRSTLLKKFRAGDIAGAAEEFDRWVFANKVRLNGLVARRAAEKALFLQKSSDAAEGNL
jgi:lysozyme